MLREFVELAEKREMPFSALCDRFGISRKTGYKWLNRFRTNGEAGLLEQSRRPKTSPRRTPEGVVEAVLALRRAQPDWSIARLRDELQRQGVEPLPAASTVDLILRRQRETAAAQRLALGADAQRFEPNFRWTIRGGAALRLADGIECAANFVRDENTGFLPGATLAAPGAEVPREFLESLFQRHGLPWRLVVSRPETQRGEAAVRLHSALTVWCMRLGVTVEFSFLPGSTDGAKDARQQLAARLAHLPAYQRAPLEERAAVTVDPLDQFARAARRLDSAHAIALLEQLREQHNFGGRQEALQRRSPISLYRPGDRALPPVLPEPVYAPEAEVRLVSEKGIFTFQRRLVHVGRLFAGQCVELKITPHPDRFVVLFAGQTLGWVDLSAAPVDSTASLALNAV